MSDKIWPSWLAKFKTYEGQFCPTGKPPTPWIIETFEKYTTFPRRDWEDPDKTPPACAAGMCRVMTESGYKSTRNPGAASWIGFGISCGLIQGAILVLQHTDGQLKDHYHVTLLEEVIQIENGIPKLIKCFGSNQNHLVGSAVFDMNHYRIVSCCSPRPL